ncbi:reverse transcriptase domain-containing protein [Tanacetum coccineum]|uniref:Reverse transcriptase domain-containing protein n=1 Tax=Tanacetum coccineum TaxID=301880 RepID=A0ABQ5FQ15_9ASTR
MVKALLLDKKNQNQAPTAVKAIEQSCVTCGGAHSYRNCLATDGNVYRDNIQEYVSQAAAANFNQGNTNSRPPMVANQIRPPGFPPIQNNQNRFNQNQGNNFNQNRGTNSNQNRGNNFYQGQVYQPPTSQPPVYQAQPYQAPAQQVQGVSKTDFENYVKANDAVLRNMQNQGQGLQNQIANLTDMLSKFVNANTASSSGTGTLPSNTVTNPKEDLKGITTRSGVAYKGPTIPTTSSPKVVERETEVTKDTMPPANNGSTEDVQPPVVPVVHHESISEPGNAPVSASMPNQKASIPFPSRRNDERRREKANDQIEKFYEIFRDLSFKISFTDALMLMPKFASTLKTLIGNKEKLSEMARTPLNENCSAVILNKLPKKLGDPGRFLIPCEFSGINTCNALADLGASINLMPYSEADSFLAIEDDPTSPKVDPTYYDPDGDILLLEAILNSNDKLPVIIAKDLKNEEKAALIEVLKSHKRAIAWKLSDIKGIDPEFCTHKILMEEDYEPTVQSQRRVNPKIHDVIKKEVEKLLDAGLIYRSLTVHGTGSSPVSTASTNNSTACLSDATVYAYLATQPNGSQVIVISGRDTAGYDKKKVECFNCHKLGHFARECQNPKSQENRSRNQDSSRRTVNVEEASPKSMLRYRCYYHSDLIGVTYASYKDSDINGLEKQVERLKKEKEENKLVLHLLVLFIKFHGIEKFKDLKIKGFGVKVTKELLVTMFSKEEKKHQICSIIEDCVSDCDEDEE